jgi:heptaprenyl diphosphate synthase
MRELKYGKEKHTGEVVVIAFFVSLALVLSIIESCIPINVSIPGIRIGLANIITLVVIAVIGLKQAVTVVIIRTLLSSIYSGGPVVLVFSLAGGLMSAITMWLFYKYMSKVFSIIGISITGAVAHNIGQLAAAVLIMGEPAVISYFPVLMVAAVVAGSFTGICSKYLINVSKRRFFETMR